MGTLHRKANELLNELCKYYNKTGKTKIDPLEAGISYQYDPFYTDLVVNGYITAPSGLTGELTLLQCAVDYAKNLL